MKATAPHLTKTQPEEMIARDEAIARIRAGLKKRTGRAWSVTGGKGSSYDWITVQALPKDREGFGYIKAEDRVILAQALGLAHVHMQGLLIPASYGHRVEYVDRAEGRAPRKLGEQYWD